MARPRKTGLDYFPFDVGFFEDEKIACIAGEFGIKGEITAIRLLCAIYRNGYFILWSEQLKMKMLRQMPGVSSELFDQILNRLVRWGFFDASLFDTVKVLTSVGIQRRYFEATKFRIMDKNLPYLLISDDKPKHGRGGVSQTLTPVSQTLTPVSHWEMPQNKIKLKDNKLSSPLTPQGGNAEEALSKKIEEYKTQKPAWKDSIQMKFGLSPGQVDKLLDEFLLDMRIKEIDVHKVGAFFLSWLTRRQYGNSRANNQQSEWSGRNGVQFKGSVDFDCGLELPPNSEA